MARRQQTGMYGEDIAVDYLLQKEYRIIHRNWRFGRSEIDIISEKDNTLIFVEVKTRSNDLFGKPEEFLSRRQESLITDAAAAYMRMVNHNLEFRFDIISVLILYGKPCISHFKDAFFPGL